MPPYDQDKWVDIPDPNSDWKDIPDPTTPAPAPTQQATPEAQHRDALAPYLKWFNHPLDEVGRGATNLVSGLAKAGRSIVDMPQYSLGGFTPNQVGLPTIAKDIYSAAAGMGKQYLNPASSIGEQSEHLARQVTAAFGNYDPQMGVLNAPSYAVSPYSKLGLIAAQQLGYDPESTISDIQNKKYVSAAAHMVVPTAMGVGMLHGALRGKVTPETPLPPEQMNLPFEPGKYNGGAPRPTPFIPDQPPAGTEHLPGPSFPDMGGTQPNLPGLTSKSLGGEYGQSAFKFPEGPVKSADFDPQPWRNWKQSETPTSTEPTEPAPTPAPSISQPAPSIQVDIPGVDITMGPDGVNSVEIRGNAAKPENLVKLRAAGFGPAAEGTRSKAGFAVWVQDPNAPAGATSTPAAPYTAPTKARARAGAKPPGGVKIEKDGSVSVPEGMGQDYYDNLSKQGYNFDKTLPNGNSRFVKGLPSDAGSVDITPLRDFMDRIRGKDKLTPEENQELWRIFNSNKSPENVEPPPTGTEKLRIDQNIDAARREPINPEDKELGELRKQAGEAEPKTQQEIDDNHRALAYFVDKYGADWLGEFQRAERQGTVEMEVKHNYVRPGVHGAAVAAREKPQGLLSKYFSDDRGQVGPDINAGYNPNMRWGYNKAEVDKFRNGLPEAKKWEDTRFILPGGQRLTHTSSIHAVAARSIGSTLTDALNSGIMRVNTRFTGVEISRPITIGQAQAVLDGAMQLGIKEVGIDITSDGRFKKAAYFPSDTSPRALVKWTEENVEKPQQPGTSGLQPAAPWGRGRGTREEIIDPERGSVGPFTTGGGGGEMKWGYNKEVVDKFRNGLPKAESWNSTRFILPSGERLTHNFPIHEQGAESVGSSLTEALQSGIMRVGAGFWGAEVNRPITEAMAKSLIQGASNVGRDSVGIDVIGDDYYRSGYRRSKNFNLGEVTPKDIVKWVDSVVMRPGGEAPKAPRPFRFGLGDDRGAVGPDINAGESPKIPVKPGDSTGPVNNAKLKDGTTWDKVRARTGWGKGGTIRSTEEKQAEHNFVDESWAIAKNLDTIGDYSGIKQTFPLWYTKQFREGIIPMIKAGWSRDLSMAIEDQLKELPIMEHYLDANGNEMPSVADKIGFKLRDTVDNRAELVSSKWVENGQFFGLRDNPASRFYSKTLGAVARGSNRAFTTIRNHVGANRLQFLMDAARDISISAEEKGYARPGFLHMKQAFTPEEAVDLNPYNNLVLGRDISDYVRTVIGDAPLKTHVLPFRGGEWNIESSTKHLGRFFFAPRNIAKQVRMMNPSTYIMATPMVRKQYMTSMLATMGAAAAISEMSMLAANAAGIPATVNWTHPTDADWGKLKIGDTRFDFGQGFLPYFVLGHRLWNGGYTSSTTHKFTKFGSDIGIETMTGTGLNFLSNKLDPLMKFAWDLGNSSDFRAFNAGDRTAQLFMAMAPLDIWNIWKTKPYLVPASIIPILAGAGTQTYGRGAHTGVDVESRIVSPRIDAIIKGGGPRDWLHEIGKAGQRDIRSMGF